MPHKAKRLQSGLIWHWHVAGLMKEGIHTTVIAHAEITKEELDVERGVRKALGDRGRLHLVWGNTLYEKDQLPLKPDMSDLSDVFTPFRNKVLPSESLLAQLYTLTSNAVKVL